MTLLQSRYARLEFIVDSSLRFDADFFDSVMEHAMTKGLCRRRGSSQNKISQFLIYNDRRNNPPLSKLHLKEERVPQVVQMDEEEEEEVLVEVQRHDAFNQETLQMDFEKMMMEEEEEEEKEYHHHRPEEQNEEEFNNYKISYKVILFKFEDPLDQVVLEDVFEHVPILKGHYLPFKTQDTTDEISKEHLFRNLWQGMSHSLLYTVEY